MHRRRGETLIDMLMTVVIPIVGGIAGSLVLSHFTPLPFWTCILLGIPLGTIAAWLLFLGLAIAFSLLVLRPLEIVHERRKRRIRDRNRNGESKRGIETGTQLVVAPVVPVSAGWVIMARNPVLADISLANNLLHDHE